MRTYYAILLVMTAFVVGVSVGREVTRAADAPVEIQGEARLPIHEPKGACVEYGDGFAVVYSARDDGKCHTDADAPRCSKIGG